MLFIGCNKSVRKSLNSANNTSLGIPGNASMYLNIVPETIAQNITAEELNHLNVSYDSFGMWVSSHTYYIGTENNHHYFIHHHAELLSTRKIYRIHKDKYQVKKTKKLSMSNYNPTNEIKSPKNNYFNNNNNFILEHPYPYIMPNGNQILQLDFNPNINKFNFVNKNAGNTVNLSNGNIQLGY